MAKLYVRLLGAPEATLDGQPIVNFGSAKALALLAYLAVESDRPHRRASLAALLWPDYPERSARSNLRNALSSLRGVIGDRLSPCARAPAHADVAHADVAHADVRGRAPPVLLVTRESVCFNCESSCWVDVRAFRMLIEHHSPGFSDISDLLEAISLYRGPFLEGFSVKDSVAFDDWALLERDRLHRLASSALESLISSYAEQGNPTEACAHAWRRVALEPWREDAYLQLMRVLALSGERTTALAQYDACCEMLAEEFGVEPSPQMQRLYAQIRDGMFVAQRPAAPVAVQAAPASTMVECELPLFVGREGELAALEAHLDRVLAGHGRVVFVTGEAGEGKTALIQAFAQRALRKHRSLIPACGNCNAYTGVGDPYLPFREILEMLAGDAAPRGAAAAIGGGFGDRLKNAFPLVVQALLREGKDLIDIFVPGTQLLAQVSSYARQDTVWNGNARGPHTWRAALQTEVARKAAEPANGVQQEDLFRQYTAALKQVAQHTPLLLVLDDLQWADVGSLSLLFHLGRRLEGSPILVVGAYRSEEVALGRDGERHPLAPVVNEFARTWGDIKVDVGYANGASFVAALLDSEPNDLGSAFRETMVRQTRGHPLFTVELLRGMQERGDLLRDAAGRWVEGHALDWERLPARVEAVIAERVNRLSAPLRATLRTASVEGEVFTAEVLARVQAAGSREMVAMLSGELDRRHHLVRAQGMQRVGDQQLSRYRFRHILFQRYLYNSLDEVERAHTHAEVGAALQESCAGSEEVAASALPQLAWHAEQAGLISEAVDAYQRAGDRALHMSANREAYDHFRRAIRLLESLPATSERDKRELALQFALTVPLTALRSWAAPETGVVYQRIWELSRTHGNEDQRMRALGFRRGWHTVRSDHGKALALAREYYEKAQRSGDPLLQFLRHYELCIALLFVGSLRESLDHAERVLSLYDPQEHQSLTYRLAQDPAVVAYLIALYDLWYLGYPDRAVQMSDAGVAYATEMDHPFSLMFMVCFKARLHRWRREVAEVEKLSAVQRSAWVDHQMEMGHVGALVDGAWVMFKRGQPEAAAKQYEEGLAAWAVTGMANHLPEFWSVLAEMYAKAGQVEKALGLIADALARIEATEERYHEAEVYRLRGEFRLQQDGASAVEAERDFRQAIEIARRQEARMLELRATVSLCRLWLAQGQAEKLREGREMLDAIYGWFTEGFETQDLREAERVLGLIKSQES